jgi:tRNA threonylcarbamoyladenosine modification (KEOPS) complex Cgi121 subunit
MAVKNSYGVNTLHYIKLDNKTSSIILGIKGVMIDNPQQFLRNLRDNFPNLIIQTLDTNFVAGFEHLKMILQQSWMAFNRGVSYTKKLDLELIVRTACDSQIERALKTIGLKPGKMNIALVAIGEIKNLKLFIKSIKNLGEVSDDAIKLNPEKKKFLIKHHSISDELIKATIFDRNKLAAILSEKANLLRI